MAPAAVHGTAPTRRCHGEPAQGPHHARFRAFPVKTPYPVVGSRHLSSGNLVGWFGHLVSLSLVAPLRWVPLFVSLSGCTPSRPKQFSSAMPVSVSRGTTITWDLLASLGGLHQGSLSTLLLLFQASAFSQRGRLASLLTAGAVTGSLALGITGAVAGASPSPTSHSPPPPLPPPLQPSLPDVVTRGHPTQAISSLVHACYVNSRDDSR